VPNLKRQQGYRKNKSFHNWLKRHTWHISKKKIKRGACNL
jgi:hypothetical protein